MKGVHRLPQLSAELSQGRRPQGTRHLVCAQTRSVSSGENRPGLPCRLSSVWTPAAAFAQAAGPEFPVSPLTWRPGQGPRSAMAARGLFSAEVLVRRQHAPLVQVVSAYFKQPGDGRDVAFCCTCCLRV